jgi:hypothetical protein
VSKVGKFIEERKQRAELPQLGGVPRKGWRGSPPSRSLSSGLYCCKKKISDKDILATIQIAFLGQPGMCMLYLCFLSYQVSDHVSDNG